MVWVGEIPGGPVIIPPSSGNTVKFTDISGHWAEQAIRKLAKEGVINGKSNTVFAPEDTMTRAEFAALIRRALGLNLVLYKGECADISGGEWYASEIQTILSAGIMSGDGDENFRPNEEISRQEMAKVIVNAYLLKAGAADVTAGEPGFADTGEIAGWAKEYVGKAVSLNPITGLDDNTFRPHASTTRAQGAAVINRLIG